MTRPSQLARPLVLLALLGACSSAGPARYPVAVPPATGRVATSVPSIEVREAELPLYAELEEIYVEGEGGALQSDTDVLWADEQQRVVTEGLVSALGGLTSARVAAEPWPLDAPPEARLTVRLTRLLAGADGVFRMTGQYYLARFSGGERSGRFDIAVPLASLPPTPQAVAAAEGRAIAELARQIADQAL